MKFYIYSFFIIICCISCRKSTEPINQSGWHLHYENNDGITYYGIQFADELNGWIVGYSGTIKKTSDGGKSWKTQSGNVQSNLWDLCFINSNTGWICGAGNSLLKTTNAGKTWNVITVPGDSGYINVEIKFIDKDNGWMSNNHGEILKSSDGGATWNIVKQNNLGGARLAVFDKNTVYFLSQKLFRTFDGGMTWDSLAVTTPQNYAIHEMYFTDQDNGYITTRNGTGGMLIKKYPVLITKDGGNSWYCSEYVDEMMLLCCFFINENLGWLAGFEKVYKTSDGGNNWISDFEPVDFGAKEMFFLDKKDGWIITWSGDIYKYNG